MSSNSSNRIYTSIFINTENIIYALDQDNGQVLMWQNKTTNPTSIISRDLNNSHSLFVTFNGDIYIDNGYSNNRIEKWTLNATRREGVISVNGSCGGLFIDIYQRLYCSLTKDHRVFRLDLENAEKVWINAAGTGCPGPTSNMLNHPHGIFVDTDFNLYVADTYNDRIQRFQFDESYGITAAGFRSSIRFKLNKPTGIILDAQNHLFITDSHNHRIIRSIKNGFLCIAGCSGLYGDASNQLNYPHSLAFDSIGNISVTDLKNYRIQKFNLNTNSHICCSSGSNVLLLSDTNTATVQALVNSLISAGLTVDYISGGVTTYSGNPNAANYNVIVLITGNLETTDMPNNGQQSILNAQKKNSTGIVLTEWAAYHVLNGRWNTLSSFILAPRLTGITGIVSFKLTSVGHPIWNGLPTTFTTSVMLGCSQLGTITSGSVQIASSTSCNGPGVIVKPCIATAGRIVQIAHASHYIRDGGTFNWRNDNNMVTMMINAVQWAAKLI